MKKKHGTYKYELWGETVHLGIPKDKFPTNEEIETMEAKMPGCEHAWFDSSYKGKKLKYRKVLPTNTPKAIIVFMHGIATQSGNAWVTKDGRKLSFALLIEFFVNQQGYALYDFDMLGHGYSEGSPRFYIPDWRNNRDDLNKFGRLAASEHEGVPLFLSGLSYGGNLALHVGYQWQLAGDAPKSFAGLLLLAPAIVGDLPPAPVLYTLRYVLAPMMPKTTPFFMPNPVSPDRIWKDQELFNYNNEDRYTEMGLEAPGRPFSLGTAVQMMNAVDEVRNVVIPSSTIPFCVAHGTNDYAIPIDGTNLLEAEAATAKEDVAVHRIEGAYHDLLADPSAEETMKALVAFAEDRISKM